MAASLLHDDKRLKLIGKAKESVAEGDHIKALEIIEDMISVHREEEGSWLLHVEQGQVFVSLAKTTEDPVLKVAYLLAVVACLSEDVKLSGGCAHGLYDLAEHLGSVLFYKKFVDKAKQALSWESKNPLSSMDLRKLQDEKNKGLELLIKKAEFKISVHKTSPLKSCKPKAWESKNSPDPPKDEFNGLRSYWVGLDVKIKRDFMQVSIAKLRSFVEGVHKREGRDALDQILASAEKDRKWTFWMCRTKCSKKFSSAEECKTHLEQQHAADFKPSSEKCMVKRIGKDWARKISAEVWEPVDILAAVNMIKNQLADVKAFTSKSKKNGWSKEWPLAADEERSNLLEEIRLLLVKFCDHQILSCIIRDWVMRIPLEHLVKLEVSRQSLNDSHLAETPQSICFLECHELNQILNLLKTIRCERNDGTELVCKAVDSQLDRTRVKETIDFDEKFSFALLDKRLLKSNKALLDNEGTINVLDPNVHYAKVHAQGDNIISWLVDYSSVDKSFPKPIRKHNLDIWVAVLKAVQFTCRTLETKYAKKKQVLYYEAALTVVGILCMREDERRMNLPEDQWNSYASLLCDKCEERAPGNSLTTIVFLCAVRDVFEQASGPTVDYPDLEDCLDLIRKRKSLSDSIVRKSIDHLKAVVTYKVLRIDSNILLIDNSRIRLLNSLTGLSFFDNRSYMLQLLKPFLLNEIVNMESKSKSDATEADLLRDEEKKSQTKKKKQKTKSIEKTSTSMSSPLDKTVEHEPSVNLKLEEDSIEPEDGRLEISSNTDIQVDASKVDGDMQNMPGEDSLSVNLDSMLGGAAARYNPALDITLKALLNINVLNEDLKQNEQPFHEELEEQVPCALQNFFTAVVSGEIKTEGVYSVILSDLLASLEEVLSMSSDAAEVLVYIFEFWHCWRNSEKESLVARLFTLEENERMSCRKCRRKSNYPEQSSYGIVMAADSIRDLKCAFGNIKFVDILKVIRMEYKMLCDIKTGGCGKTNFVHRIISRCPPIFTIVVQWEKSDTEKEISETTKAMDWEIDISRLYEGLEPNTNYRLVSMVGCDEADEHICIAHEKNRWVSLRHSESLAREVVGNWKSVVRFCGERKVRPEILFYEAARSMT
ncbi:uncharacterized protein LOC18012939 isoform X2 [Eutrema salsugineum]|uniref:uncharacterized protein LOC18012939 isoform X2 n=1 Tax=Eutrema salsugineum TaxID=72664 RepID=UPI000CED126D|nr:uncharacterized protein LOC18012939 isoform X2 [Eutrema salsugineum]